MLNFSVMKLCLSTFAGPGSSQQNYAHLVLLNFL